jgi:hypothetical protein
MSESLQVLVQYGYLILFGFVLVQQLGLPIPVVRSSSASVRSPAWRR